MSERDKVIETLKAIIHSKDHFGYLDGDDLADIVLMICEEFEIEYPKNM